MMVSEKFPPLIGEGKGGVHVMASKIKHYTQTIVKLSRSLRSNPTETEKKLWNHLRQNQLGGFKFRRQFPIGNFIVDFVCVERKLVIEVDGGQHSESEHDRTRDNIIKAHGYHILRFWNNEVLENSEGVLQSINSALLTLTPPQPSPKRGGSLNKELV